MWINGILILRSWQNLTKYFHRQFMSKILKLKLKIFHLKGPSLLHCLVDKNEEISPMLLAGQTLDKMWTDGR